MSLAAALQPIHETPAAAVFLLPDEPWARRVSGVYSNDLVNLHPARAHAVLTEIGGGDLLVSVRAPLANRTGADEICRQFPTGGGRKAAAGIAVRVLYDEIGSHALPKSYAETLRAAGIAVSAFHTTRGRRKFGKQPRPSTLNSNGAKPAHAALSAASISPSRLAGVSPRNFRV